MEHDPAEDGAAWHDEFFRIHQENGHRRICGQTGTAGAEGDVSLLRYSSNNLNQLTRRVHETGRIYDADLEDISQGHERLWDAARDILAALAKLK